MSTLDLLVGARGDDDVERNSGCIYVLILDYAGYQAGGGLVTLKHFKLRNFVFYGSQLLGE
jgi:hypothetical protein